MLVNFPVITLYIVCMQKAVALIIKWNKIWTLNGSLWGLPRGIISLWDRNSVNWVTCRQGVYLKTYLLKTQVLGGMNSIQMSHIRDRNLMVSCSWHCCLPGSTRAGHQMTARARKESQDNLLGQVCAPQVSNLQRHNHVPEERNITLLELYLLLRK